MACCFIARKSSTLRIRTTAILDVAGVYGEPIEPHGDRQIAPAAKRLAHAGDTGQQRLVNEQRR